MEENYKNLVELTANISLIDALIKSKIDELEHDYEYSLEDNLIYNNITKTADLKSFDNRYNTKLRSELLEIKLMLEVNKDIILNKLGKKLLENDTQPIYSTLTAISVPYYDIGITRDKLTEIISAELDKIK